MDSQQRGPEVGLGEVWCCWMPLSSDLREARFWTASVLRTLDHSIALGHIGVSMDGVRQTLPAILPNNPKAASTASPSLGRKPKMAGRPRIETF